MKGIVLAGGSGTRLYSLTQVINKHLLPVYDKPMIYYPLSVLMLAGIREIMLISTPEALPLFEKLLGSGGRWGINICYETQKKPNGIAEAFIIGKKFLNRSPSCLVLGDNILYGHGLTETLRSAAQLNDGGVVFAYRVRDPERYGVVEFDRNGHIISLEEKPAKPKSNFVVPGIYFYDGNASTFAEQIKPSARGELEITDLNREYLRQGKLKVLPLGRGIAWLDTGTHESLLQAGTFIHTIDSRQGFKVACLEEIAFLKTFITAGELSELADEMKDCSYGDYLRNLLSGNPIFL